MDLPQALLAGLGTLAAVVIKLWMFSVAQARKCQREHDKQAAEIAALQLKLGRLYGEVDIRRACKLDDCPFRPEPPAPATPPRIGPFPGLPSPV